MVQQPEPLRQPGHPNIGNLAWNFTLLYFPLEKGSGQFMGMIPGDWSLWSFLALDFTVRKTEGCETEMVSGIDPCFLPLGDKLRPYQLARIYGSFLKTVSLSMILNGQRLRTRFPEVDLNRSWGYPAHNAAHGTAS